MTDLHRLLLEDFATQHTKLHQIVKKELYAMLYGSDGPMQTRIDEEGSGPTFAALKYADVP